MPLDRLTQDICICRECSFTLKNVVIEDCILSQEHAVAGIIETDQCRRRSQSREPIGHRIRLSNVIFRRNRNEGGAVGIFVQNPRCHTDVRLKAVTFEQNRYANASILARENSLRNVRVVENESVRATAPETFFFSFPESSSSLIVNLTAVDNRNASVVYVEHGNVDIRGSRFVGNVGNGQGVIGVKSSSLIATNSSFQRNFCRCNGSAVSLLRPSSADFSFCEFSHNRAIGLGGSVHSRNAHDIHFTSCLFEHNVAVDSGKGGAVYLEGDTVHARLHENDARRIVFANSTFVENAADEGGAIALWGGEGEILFESCNMSKNGGPWRGYADPSDKGGGAVLIYRSHIRRFLAAACRFDSNTGKRGGGISFVETEGDFVILDSHFVENRVSSEGAAVSLNTPRQFVDAYSETPKAILTTRRCVFVRNQGITLGGAVYVSGAESVAELNNSRFLKNNGNKGGAVVAEIARQLIIENSEFESNTARHEGGAIFIETTDAVIGGSIFIENKGQFGGAVAAGAVAPAEAANLTIRTDLFMSDNQFSGNEAEGRGGALNIDYESSSTAHAMHEVNLHRSSLVGNRAGSAGGAVHAHMDGLFSMSESTFEKNRARFGGGLSLFCGAKDVPWRRRNEGQWLIDRSSFRENSASIGGNI